MDIPITTGPRGKRELAGGTVNGSGISAGRVWAGWWIAALRLRYGNGGISPFISVLGDQSCRRARATVGGYRRW